MKVVVAFDETATEDQVKIYNEFLEKMAIAGAKVESIGGGVKNPK
ncbi:hypothetical protein ACI3QN_13495 [Propionibacterium freudenreichii]